LIEILKKPIRSNTVVKAAIRLAPATVTDAFAGRF
jgi:hypothetical protein